MNVSSFEEEKRAVLTLSSDMTQNFSSSLTSDDIASSLTQSYTFYSEYLPSFVLIKERYLSAVIEILEDEFSSAFVSIITDASQVEADAPSRFIDGDMLSSALESSTREEAASALREIIDAHKDELDSAYGESESTFSKIQRSYRSLVIVDISLSIPDSEPFDEESLISLVLNKYYSILSDNETKLRNNPLYGESSYRLFWR